MGRAVLEQSQAIKISSKRQITIPAHIYKQAGFKDYALCTWTEDGLLVQPLDVHDDCVSVEILRRLVDAGYEGDELVEKYEEMYRSLVPVSTLIEEAEQDVAAGRVDTVDAMMDRLQEKYGI